MTDRRYTNPRTGEVVDDPTIRPFDQVLRELSEGATNSELSEALWDLVQRVQDTGKERQPSRSTPGSGSRFARASSPWA